MKNLLGILICSLPLILVACTEEEMVSWYPEAGPIYYRGPQAPTNLSDTSHYKSEVAKAARHAEYQTTQQTTYDGSWVNIGYPGGDPGYQQGVCTDVVIRALRFIDIDLQELIHVDMKRAHSDYNRRYYSKVIDNNIDHRRTQNIQTLLTRVGARIKTPVNNIDYRPGDILFWNIAAGHTGIVVNSINPRTGNYYVVHNIGGGAMYEDMLAYWEPSEVYRLTDNDVVKLQEDCTFKYNQDKDFKTYVQ